LCEMNSDIKKVLEYSNRLRFETTLESSRQEYLHALLNHLFEDVETGLELNMGNKHPEKENCTSKFTALLKHNGGLIKNKNVAETLISEKRLKLDELRCEAPYRKCEQCYSEVLSTFIKQINLMRSMKIYKNNPEQ